MKLAHSLLQAWLFDGFKFYSENLACFTIFSYETFENKMQACAKALRCLAGETEDVDIRSWELSV